MGPIDILDRRRLLVITGKGGVGKTVVTAALGRVLAARGRRVLLLEVDPRESLYALSGVEPSGGGYRWVAERLWIQNVRPREVLDRLVRRKLHAGPFAGRILSSPVYAQFAEGAPGLKELAVLSHVHDVLRGQAGDAPEVDAVLLDAPATGHALALLEAPRLVTGAIADGPVGRMAAELSGFCDDAEQVGVVVVTRAREMPVQETAELLEALDRRIGRPPELVAVNALWPVAPEEPGTAERGGVTTEEAADEAGDWRSLWLARRRADDEQLRRLAALWAGPRVELPRLAAGGPELLDRLTEALAEALAGAPANGERR